VKQGDWILSKQETAMHEMMYWWQAKFEEKSRDLQIRTESV